MKHDYLPAGGDNGTLEGAQSACDASRFGPDERFRETGETALTAATDDSSGSDDADLEARVTELESLVNDMGQMLNQLLEDSDSGKKR